MITSLGDERAGLCVSHAFVFFIIARVDFCPSPLSLSVGGCLRLVTVAHPGFFY